MLRHAKPAGIALASLGLVAAAHGQGAQQEVSIVANVLSSCRVGGSHTPAALNTTIPVNSAGQVDTTTQTFLVSNAFCTLPTTVVATSTKGGVKSATNAPSGFTNIINYRAVVRFGFAQSIINTATIPTATGPEPGSAGSTFLPWFGALRIQITPAATAQPLVAGSDYNDVLRITLTPD